MQHVSHDVTYVLRMACVLRSPRIVVALGSACADARRRVAAIVAPINGISYQDKQLQVPCGQDGKAGTSSPRSRARLVLQQRAGSPVTSALLNFKGCPDGIRAPLHIPD